MRRIDTKKKANTMSVKKLITGLIATLLILVPMQGLNATAAYANGLTTTLSTFKVNGEDVENESVVFVLKGTTSVPIEVETTDPLATAVITGGTGLVLGDNDLFVSVTSANGLVDATYSVNIFVFEPSEYFSNDASLSRLALNGNLITEGQIIEVPALTTDVLVSTTTTHPNATPVINGSRGLVTGLNDLSVVVTAEDGITTRTYAFKVRVLELPSDVALETFTVNGQAVRNGGRVYLEPGTQSVAVVATPSDLSASVEITGRTGLLAGANTLKVVVTALSGRTATYEVTLNVQIPSSDSSLVVFKVSGARVTDGTTVYVPSGTTAVAVTAIPSDSAASVSVTGSNNLVLGENTLKVVVTAEDGTTTTSTLTLNVLANDDTSLAVFQYDGSDVANGDEFELESGTTSVEIIAEATSELSDVEIIGADALVSGRNVVKVQVTAQDTSVSTYLLIFNVSASADTTLSTLTVAGQDAIGLEVTVPAGTRSVVVTAVTSDPFASYTVEGNEELIAGANTVTITVTAADGETEGTFDVAVTVIDLQLLDDVSLAMFLVNGIDALENDAIELPYGTTRVNVKVETTDPTSSYIVVGDGRITPLVPGENELILTVTAANGDSENYSVLLTVLEISTNNSLDPDGGLFVDGEQVDLEILDSTSFVNVPLNTTVVRILAKAEIPTSDVIANGKNMLPSSTRAFAVEKGVNEIAIQVIPEAGNSYAKTYKLKVYVGGADTTLKTVKVNATTITIGVDNAGNLQTPLPAGTKTATMYIEPTVAEAVGLGNGTKVELDGGDVIATRSNVANTWNLSGLVGGENTISITVTPGDANAEQGSYSIAIPVTVSTDTRLKTFTVNGAKVTPGIAITLKKFTTSVVIAATPQDPLSTVEVSGGDDLTPGFNTLTVTVTAEDGSTKDYEVRAVVPKDTKVAVVSFPKLGVVKFDKKSTPKGFDSLAKALKVVKGTVAIVKITDNFLIGKDKKTAGPLRAQNVKKYLASLKTNGFKNAIYLYGPDPKAKTAKGLVVTIYTY